ncbi:MAG: discoidin domain-containing protein, partial [Bacteroidaceae bacterium]|nr:discoidin domain-containing protein [Bacteroidaceae bacterium]
MRKFTLLFMLLLLYVCNSAMAQVTIPVPDGIYHLFWEVNSRGYLTYHEGDYPNEAKLSGVTLTDCQNLHYAATASGIKTNWYLITSDLGLRYLFEITTGKFLSVGSTDATDNGSKINVLSTTAPWPITLETPVNRPTANEIPYGTSNISFQLRAIGADGTAYRLCSGCGTGKEGHPVRWEKSNLNDGGFPIDFVSNATASVSDDVLNNAKAAIAAYEQTLTETIAKAQAVIDETGFTCTKGSFLDISGKLSSNAAHNDGTANKDGGAITVLTDGNVNQYFHTRWGGGEVNAPHHIQVDLGADVSLSDFYFDYQTRNTMGNDASPCPIEITVYGSNNAQDFTELALLSGGMPQYNVAAGTYHSPIISSATSYRYLRFAVTRSEGPAAEIYGGQYFFGMSEFKLGAVSVSYYEGLGDVVPQIKAIVAAISEAKQNKRTIAGAIENINTQIDAYKQALKTNAANIVDGWGGVGYPAASAIDAYRTAIAAAENYNAVNAAKNALYSAEIQMPEDGKAYYIKAKYNDGTYRYIYRTDAGKLQVNPTNNAKPADYAGIFVFRSLDNGKYALAHNSGEYMVYYADGKNGAGGHNDGFAPTYELGTQDAEIKFIPGGSVNATNPSTVDERTEFMGGFAMQAYNSSSSALFYMMAGNPDFHSAGSSSVYYQGGNRSSIFCLEEATYANTPTLNSISGSALIMNFEEEAMATFSAPFPTVLPTGVTAYYAKRDDCNSEVISLTAYEGDAL